MQACVLLVLWVCVTANEGRLGSANKTRACRENYRHFDGIFSGQIEELFGQTSALVKIKRVIKGDSRYQSHFIILENLRNCPKIRKVKIRDSRLFSGKLIRDGVFELVSPLWPITLTNLRRANFIAHTVQRRQHRSHNKSGKIR